jgi:hypothetical protein
MLASAAYSLTLKMGAVRCYEASVNFYHATKCNFRSQKYCDVYAVGNMASVYNGCHSNQSTVNSRCDVNKMADAINNMANARAAAGATNIT